MRFLCFHACVSVLYTVCNLLITDTSVAVRLPWLMLLRSLSGFNAFIWLPTHHVSALFGTRFMDVTSPMYDLHITRILIKFVVIFWKAGVNLKNLRSQR